MNDAFVLLPGRGDFFGALDSVIGSAHCFNPNASSQQEQPDSTTHRALLRQLPVSASERMGWNALRS